VKRHNHVALPWGGDFQYMNAEYGYKQLETMIKYINTNNKHNIKLFMSTPQKYVDEVKKMNIVFKT
jgi:lysosomal alpha-mannosidase